MQVGSNWYYLDYGTADKIYNGDGIELVATAVPEPGTWACMISGLGILIAVQSRRKRRPM